MRWRAKVIIDFRSTNRLFRHKYITYLLSGITIIVLIAVLGAYILTPVEELILERDYLELNIDEVAILKVNINPHFANYQKLNWETSDPTVALVSANGLVEAVNKGIATITVSASGSKEQASCEVKVIGAELLSWENGFYEGEQENGVPHGCGTWSGNNESYEGQWWLGEKQGYGVYNYSDHSRYEGEWLANERSGQGEWNSPNGERYSGNWKDNYFHGTGIYTWPDGTIYQGDFVIGRKEGFGKITWSSGKSFEGQWEDDQAFTEWDGGSYKGDLRDAIPHGKGIIEMENGEYYYGDWVNGEKHGKGWFRYVNGNSYSGEIINNKKHGQGTYFFNSFVEYLPLDGEWIDDRLIKYRNIDIQEEIDLEQAIWWQNGVYIGELRDGKPHGKGLWIDSFYLQHPGYYGEWKNGLKEGWGVMLGILYQDMEQYAGEWQNNVKQGRGSMTFADGSNYEGTWVNNKPHGLGVYTLPDGTTIQGEWDFGQPWGNMIINKSETADNISKKSKAAQELKDKDFYDDPLLQNLGLTKENIVLMYGIPSSIYYGSSNSGSYHYENLEMKFYFTEEIVDSIFLSGNQELLGIFIGVDPVQTIKGILGQPVMYIQCEGDCYEMCLGEQITFFFGDYKGNNPELQIKFATLSHEINAPVRHAWISWDRHENW